MQIRIRKQNGERRVRSSLLFKRPWFSRRFACGRNQFGSVSIRPISQQRRPWSRRRYSRPSRQAPARIGRSPTLQFAASACRMKSGKACRAAAAEDANCSRVASCTPSASSFAACHNACMRAAMREFSNAVQVGSDRNRRTRLRAGFEKTAAQYRDGPHHILDPHTARLNRVHAVALQLLQPPSK